MSATHSHALFALLCLALALPRDADACGACFSPPSPDHASVVTDHRMVLALSSTRTVLWDQFRYSGNPEDFVWALPLSGVMRAEVTVSTDAFVDALDLLTAPIIEAATPDGCVRADGGAPTGVTLRRETALSPTATLLSDPDGATHEVSVGPYETVLLDGRRPEQRLDVWLAAHGYALPDAARVAVDHYTELAMGWVVLRMRPDSYVQRMVPVRITLDGYQPSLPLRMLVAGGSDTVGLTLFVVAESAMRVEGARDARVDTVGLTWASGAPRSNYRELFARAVGDVREHVWVTEAVLPRDLRASSTGSDERALASSFERAPTITRLRTELARAVLDRDLRIEPSDAPTLTPHYSARVTGVTTCGPSDGGVGARGGYDAEVFFVGDKPSIGCACSSAMARGSTTPKLSLVVVAMVALMRRRAFARFLPRY